jgi:indole-3-glycerol phosphate synthase
VTGTRRLSQAIAEGDGISVIVHVTDLDSAREAEAQRAEGVAIEGRIDGIRDAVALPVFWSATGGPNDAHDSGADAWRLAVKQYEDDERELVAVHDRAMSLGLECVVEVRDEDELQLALDHLDPEVFLLAADPGDDDEALDQVLALLPDVPAGKLAIADVPVRDREEVVSLERAGIDAVLVPPGHVGDLVGGVPPEV